MQPYHAYDSSRFYFNCNNGSTEVAKVVDFAFRNVHFSREEKCGTDQKQELSGVTISGPYSIEFYCSGSIVVHYQNGGNKSYKITDYPYNGSSYEVTIDSTQTDSLFVYKMFYSKSKGIVKYYKRNGNVYNLNQ